MGALAEEVGMKRPYFSARINGHRDFTSGQLLAIGKKLGVPTWKLVQRVEEASGDAVVLTATSSPSQRIGTPSDGEDGSQA